MVGAILLEKLVKMYPWNAWKSDAITGQGCVGDQITLEFFLASQFNTIMKTFFSVWINAMGQMKSQYGLLRRKSPDFLNKIVVIWGLFNLLGPGPKDND